MEIDSKETEISDALISYFGGFFASSDPLYTLDLALPFDWYPNESDPSSTYPTNPYLQTPAAYYRLYTESITYDYIAGGQAFSVLYPFSIWYYRRQIPGEKHHKIMTQYAKKIKKPVLTDGLKPNISIDGFVLEAVRPKGTVYHNQLAHEFDDHFLRVSLIEVPFEISGKMVYC